MNVRVGRSAPFRAKKKPCRRQLPGVGIAANKPARLEVLRENLNRKQSTAQQQASRVNVRCSQRRCEPGRSRMCGAWRWMGPGEMKKAAA
jgi:hypothetical protein